MSTNSNSYAPNNTLRFYGNLKSTTSPFPSKSFNSMKKRSRKPNKSFTASVSKSESTSASVSSSHSTVPNGITLKPVRKVIPANYFLDRKSGKIPSPAISGALSEASDPEELDSAPVLRQESFQIPALSQGSLPAETSVEIPSKPVPEPNAFKLSPLNSNFVGESRDAVLSRRSARYDIERLNNFRTTPRLLVRLPSRVLDYPQILNEHGTGYYDDLSQTCGPYLGATPSSIVIPYSRLFHKEPAAADPCDKSPSKSESISECSNAPAGSVAGSPMPKTL